MLRKIIPISIVAVAVFAANSLIITFAEPVQVVTSNHADITSEFKQISQGKVTVVTADKLKSGGVGNLSATTRGYVDFFDSSPTIYVNTSTSTETRNRTYLLTHEYSHVIQKRLLAKTSGGYPSKINPVTSSIYYANLLRLNNALADYTPSLPKDYDGTTFLPNIETNADCITQQEGLWPNSGSYIGITFCSDNQLAAAEAIIKGEWPTPSRVAHYAKQIRQKTLEAQKPQQIPSAANYGH